MTQDPTTRFSRTVEYYVLYRPTYPTALIDFLKSGLKLLPESVIADVGAGTGKLTELFLNNNNLTYAIEPNREMRLAAEQLLDHYKNFISIDGTAERTALSEQSVDFITAGTAFHWFEPAATRREFQRILKPNGYVLLVWNNRNNGRSTFMPAYENFLLENADDYRKVIETYPEPAQFDRFFGEKNWQQVIFENSQVFDFEGLVGRYLSCSYAFPENHSKFADAKAALRVLFDEYQQNGTVTLWYDTILYYGKLGS